MFIGYAARACSSSATRPNHTLIRPARTGWATRCVAGLLVVGHSLGRGGLDLAEVPGVLVVEASRHSAAELQPVLLELPHVCPFLNAWPVGLPCAWTRGTVATVACRKSTRGKRYSQRSRPSGQARRPWRARVPGWWGACGWGSGMPSTVRPDPSTLGVVGERGSPPRELLAARPRQRRRPADQVWSAHDADGMGGGLCRGAAGTAW